MLRLEARIPGFGGFYLDANGEVVVYVKHRGAMPDERVRQILAEDYSHRQSSLVRRIMEPVARARMLDAQYSVSELIGVENRIWYSSRTISGFTGVGTSLLLNRVVVEFIDSVSMGRGLKAIAELNVPVDALQPEVSGPSSLQPSIQSSQPSIDLNQIKYFNSELLPTAGGLQITVMNSAIQPPLTGERGSIGYNVQNAGVTYLLTASHIDAFFHGSEGEVGDTVFQPSRETYYNGNIIPGRPIALITSNPHWPTSGDCPVVDVDDYCITADVMLATYIGYATGERKIYTSSYEGTNTGAGTLDVNRNGPYQIDSVADPALMRQYTRGFHKSGAATGTTTGQTVIPDFQRSLTVCFWPIEEGTQCPLGRSKQIGFVHFAEIQGALEREGDSGGPVFAGDAYPYLALGILSGGNSCATSPCSIFFSKWANIEAWFGLGSLNPATIQTQPPPPPPPPPSLSVSIDGPTRIRPQAMCTWQGVVAGGTAPYTYEWTIDGAPAGTDLFATGGKASGNTGSSFLVSVLVRDQSGSWGESDITVSEVASAPICST